MAIVSVQVSDKLVMKYGVKPPLVAGLSLVAAVAELHRSSLLLENGGPGLVVTWVLPTGMVEQRPSGES